MNSKTLSERTQTPISAIRYYEKIGLLPKPERGANNYRNYDESYVDKLHLIAFLRRFDFSLSTIADFLNQLRSGQVEPADITQEIDHKLTNIEKQITSLQFLQEQLQHIQTQPEDIDAFLKQVPNFL